MSQFTILYNDTNAPQVYSTIGQFDDRGDAAMWLADFLATRCHGCDVCSNPVNGCATIEEPHGCRVELCIIEMKTANDFVDEWSV